MKLIELEGGTVIITSFCFILTVSLQASRRHYYAPIYIMGYTKTRNGVLAKAVLAREMSGGQFALAPTVRRTKYADFLRARCSRDLPCFASMVRAQKKDVRQHCVRPVVIPGITVNYNDFQSRRPGRHGYCCLNSI